MKRRLLFVGFCAIFGMLTATHASEGFNAMVNAIRSRKLDMVTNMLLADTTNALVKEKDATGLTLLHIAAGQGDARIVQVILTKKPDVDVKTRAGQTPLLFAASSAYLDNLKMLLLAGADPNLEDSKGNTALIIASDQGKPDIAKALLGAKAEVNAANTDGINSLMYAAERGNRKLFQLLLDSGATLGAVDKQGNTPLHYAARRGRNELIPQMLQLLHVKNAAGQTPLDVAMLSGQKRFAGDIQKYGGTMGEKK